MISFRGFKFVFGQHLCRNTRGKDSGSSRHDVGSLSLLMWPLITHQSGSKVFKPNFEFVVTFAMAAWVCVFVCVWDKCDSFIS